jgi:hypothetical protein
MVDINQSHAATTYNLQHMMQPAMSILGFHADGLMLTKLCEQNINTYSVEIISKYKLINWGQTYIDF